MGVGSNILHYVGVLTQDEAFQTNGIATLYVEAGNGDDLIGVDFYSSRADVIYGQGGNDIVLPGGGNDIIYGDSNADDQTGGNDVLFGRLDDDAIYAGGGDDFAYGEDGDDYVFGGYGNDRLWGGTGSDLILGGPGDDVIYGSTATTKPVLPVSTQEFDGTTNTPASVAYNPNNAGAYSLVLDDSSPDRLSGGDGNDTVVGAGGADDLDGGSGNDLLDGAGGADEARGGSGNDVYRVDNARDLVKEAIGDGFDTVLSSNGFALSRGTEIEVLRTLDDGGLTALDLTGNEGAQSIVGNAGSNMLRGLDGNDALFGLAGTDHLSGGLGADSLAGGAGKDFFVFDTRPSKAAVDRIVDFSRRDDTFWIDNAILKKVGANGALKADAFHLGKKAADAEDRVIYDKVTGSLFYDADGTGAAAAVKIAVLQNKAALGLKDFVVI